MKKILCLFLLTALASGCSMKVVPDPTPNGLINTKENSQTIVSDNIAMTAASSDAELSSYNMETFVTSFAVDIENRGTNEVRFDPDDFILVDNNSRQYSALTPEKVKQIITKDSFYLLPYPYVGFYYLEDYERAASKNTMASNIPYYYEVYPQDIFTKALPAVAVIPKAKVHGLVYFGVDLATLKEVKLLVYKKGTTKSGPADFTFPFRIVK